MAQVEEPNLADISLLEVISHPFVVSSGSFELTRYILETFSHQHPHLPGLKQCFLSFRNYSSAFCLRETDHNTTTFYITLIVLCMVCTLIHPSHCCPAIIQFTISHLHRVLRVISFFLPSVRPNHTRQRNSVLSCLLSFTESFGIELSPSQSRLPCLFSFLPNILCILFLYSCQSYRQRNGS